MSAIVHTVMEALAERVVGTVEEVSADKISVLLDPDAPQATALNTGFPEGFPRLNGYLLIPNEVGATIGWVTAVRIERLPYPKRKGMQDFGLVDLPFPCRIVVLTPLGTLVHRSCAGEGDTCLEVRRGVDVFPSVGDPVLLPTREQLQAIVQGESGNARRIFIGHCPVGIDAPVYVDPDKLFGRHLAVLGNTGSGKSCSVAGLIRWSIEAAKKERESQERSGSVNARFIILDPNGEYAQAFSDMEGVRLFQVRPQPGANTKPLKVPAWLWNGEEWAAFTEASPGVQRPILFDALRRLRSAGEVPNQFLTKVLGRARRYRSRLEIALTGGEHQGKGRREGFARILTNIKDDFENLEQSSECADQALKTKLRAVAQCAAELEEEARGGVRDNGYWHDDFSEVRIENILAKLHDVVAYVNPLDDTSLISEDAPRYFPVEQMSECVRILASELSGRDLAQFVDSLNLRIRGLITRGNLAPVLHPEDTASIKLENWLADYIGQDGAANGQIAVLDLSLVPSEVIHIVVSVLVRLIFEALQWYRRENGKELPTVLVLEEAHTFIHKDLNTEGAPAAGRVCCRMIERVAREGRKFGLGLVLASQRPSELSPTVLSQCNTFLLHRIVNDRDQELVKKLVPEALGAFLRELPSLPSQRAILLGWAAPAPVLVEIRSLPEGQRPHSPDPAFWDVWTGEPTRGQRTIDWALIAREWVGPEQSEAASEEEDLTELEDSEVLDDEDGYDGAEMEWPHDDEDYEE